MLHPEVKVRAGLGSSGFKGLRVIWSQVECGEGKYQNDRRKKEQQEKAVVRIDRGGGGGGGRRKMPRGWMEEGMVGE